MAIWLASKTLDAISEAIVADSGNAFRRFQGQVLPHMLDAYREDDDAFRSHLGASVIGGKCERAIRFGHRWVHKKKPSGKKRESALHGEARMRRLWNRGHLEEGRFIAMLLAAGIQVYQQDADGNQFRIGALGGHFGGAGDGVLVGVPDLPAGIPALAEFKTHSDKSFNELVSFGVKEAKLEHYVQMQEYMHHMGLLYALYLAVNKDNDELHGEIVVYDRVCADKYLEKARRLVFDVALPRRLAGGSPGFHHCKYLCDYVEPCYHTVQPAINCRTCVNVEPLLAGGWLCRKTGAILSKEEQLAGCAMYKLDPVFNP